MRRIHRIVAGMSLAPMIFGCGSGKASNTVDATNVTDASGPGVNVLVTRPGQPNLEVQGQVIPAPAVKKSTNYGNPVPPVSSDFSVLATATDAESGIKNLKLIVTRTVCYTNSNGTVSQAYFGSKTRKEATYTDRAHAPVQASLGETGIIDASVDSLTGHNDPVKYSDTNLLAWRNANNALNVGVGVSTKWGMEATNFANKTTYSDVIFVLSGDVSCVTNP
jgi:hypothetical protein